MVPINIKIASNDAAMCRFTGRPNEIKVRPDEYKSRIAPPTRPKIATNAKITRYHVGRIVVSAPMGSVAIAPANSSLLPESAAPKITRTIGTIDAPNTVQPITLELETALGR
ncbi:unannotated protein [freshwater metagenome]|uniref:Unannotated protein n=1 Tax=freshwater metagenome TaxID=449393 RepID=A0A6J6BA98_9ZZZZ